MDQLIEGYRRFRETAWPEHRERFKTLAHEGQFPEALVIACSDSRVDPGVIFGTAPGDMFVVRNVANLIPPYIPDSEYHGTSAAIEFAVRVLKVKQVVVMGHARCGGVRTLLAGAPAEAADFVVPWMRIATKAVERARAFLHLHSHQTACEHETVRISLENLMSFPWVAERVDEGSLKLFGCWFNIETGILEVLGQDGLFRPA